MPWRRKVGCTKRRPQTAGAHSHSAACSSSRRSSGCRGSASTYEPLGRGAAALLATFATNAAFHALWFHPAMADGAVGWGYLLMLPAAGLYTTARRWKPTLVLCCRHRLRAEHDSTGASAAGTSAQPASSAAGALRRRSTKAPVLTKKSSPRR